MTTTAAQDPTLVAAFLKASAKHDRLVARYNREYRAGKWSTNRPLASACEDAYTAMVNAAAAAGIEVTK